MVHGSGKEKKTFHYKDIFELGHVSIRSLETHLHFTGDIYKDGIKQVNNISIILRKVFMERK